MCIRDRSPEAEFLLSQTDDATKQVLRAALLHEENPQAVEGTGEIRPGNIAQLNLENRVLTQHSEEQVEDVYKRQLWDYLPVHFWPLPSKVC